jgi:SDR family mycofactocin-dependent oxidoreductase
VTRVAVVTGAARGIGAAVARALAADGWALALGDVCQDDPALDYPLATAADLEEVARACTAAGAAVVAVRSDVRTQTDVDELVGRAADLGEVLAAVAAAGVIGGAGLAWQLAEDVVLRDLAVNYLGVVNLARACVPPMVSAGRGGRFVAVVSAAGATGLPLLASYSASKHAALGFVRSLAADLAPSGITANAVLPGSTDTPLLAASARVYGLSSPQDFARHQRTGRLLTPDEVAAAVRWLCSDEASGVTGAAMPVDGGFTG